MKNIIKIIKGIVVGFISIIPGISGSMMAAALNIYEELINSISNLIKSPFKSIINIWEYIVGIILGIFLGVVFVATLFQRFPLQLSFLFIGLIIGGIPQLLKEHRKKFKIKHYFTILLTITIVLLSFLLNDSSNIEIDTGGYVKYSLIGFILAVPIIIPGISGAMVLSTLGQYNNTMQIIKDFLSDLIKLKFDQMFDNTMPVILMGVGGIFGLILFAKIIKHILNKFPQMFYAVILGVLVISPVSIIFALNNELLVNNQTVLDIINTGNIVVSIFFLIFGSLVAYKTSMLKDEEIKPREVANILVSTKYMLADSLIIITSYAIPIFILTLLGQTYDYPNLIPSLITIISAKIILYYFLGMYKIITKHIDYKDLFKLIFFIILSNVLIVILLTLPEMPKFMYKSVYLIIIPIEIAGFLMYRLIIKFYLDHQDLKHKAIGGIPTLIIGAGRAGEMAITEINQNIILNNYVVGLLDDDPKKLGKTILGKKVLGEIKDLRYFVKKHNVLEVVVAIKDFHNKNLNDIFEDLKDITNIKFKQLNMMEDLDFSSEIMIKNIDYKDLLAKRRVTINEEEIKREINGKSILITGGAGSIGSNLIKQLINYNPSLIIVSDINENDMYYLKKEIEHIKTKTKFKFCLGSISNINSLNNIFINYKPDIIFHLAAYKNVLLIEENIKEAIRTNILGTYNVCLLANKYKVNNVIITSSNKALNPKSIMGSTKKYSETIAKHYNSLGNTKISIVRFGNVLGTNGSFVTNLRKEILAGGPVILDNKDTYKHLITIEDTVNVILQSLVYSIGGETFVSDMGKPINTTTLTNDLIKLYGLRPNKDINIVYSNLKKHERLSKESKIIINSNYIKTNNDKIFIEKEKQLHNLDIDFLNIINSFEEMSNDELINILLKGKD